MTLSNAFKLGPIDSNDLYHYQSLVEGNSALWIRLSYANHSCIPNSTNISYGNLALVHATRFIAEGDEITINYTGDCKDFEARKKQIRFNWGFQCECTLCKADAQCSSGDLIQRARLYKDTKVKIVANPPVQRESVSFLPQFESYLKDIDRTYSDNVYAGLPRVQLFYAQTWFLIYNTSQKLSCRQVISDMLQSLGFEVDTSGKTIQEITFTANSMLPEEAMVLLDPLVGEAVESHLSGVAAVATHLLEFAKILERVLHGTTTRTPKACEEYMSRRLGTSPADIEEKMAEMGL